jgi:hypothetical protein
MTGWQKKINGFLKVNYFYKLRRNNSIKKEGRQFKFQLSNTDRKRKMPPVTVKKRERPMKEDSYGKEGRDREK